MSWVEELKEKRKRLQNEIEDLQRQLNNALTREAKKDQLITKLRKELRELREEKNNDQS